jgi:probable rRNA maturation factor
VDGVFNVVFVNDKYIHSLNKQYRKKDKPTDVLSFSYIDTPDFKDTGLIGEIYISVPTAKRQAKEFKVILKDELNKLFVHGFLHVYGHKHDSEKDFKKMNKIENEVLSD